MNLILKIGYVAFLLGAFLFVFSVLGSFTLGGGLKTSFEQFAHYISFVNGFLPVTELVVVLATVASALFSYVLFHALTWAHWALFKE